MSSKSTKIIVDILMTIFLILSFIRWDGISGAAYHIIVGSACTIFFIIHIIIHRKWLKATTKSCLAGNLSKALRWKYIINIILIIIWGISIVTGFFALAPFFSGASESFIWARLHGVTARVGLVFIIIHIIQHWPQIKSYMRIKKKSK